MWRSYQFERRLNLSVRSLSVSLNCAFGERRERTAQDRFTRYTWGDKSVGLQNAYIPVVTQCQNFQYSWTNLQCLLCARRAATQMRETTGWVTHTIALEGPLRFLYKKGDACMSRVQLQMGLTARLSASYNFFQYISDYKISEIYLFSQKGHTCAQFRGDQ